MLKIGTKKNIVDQKKEDEKKSEDDLSIFDKDEPAGPAEIDLMNKEFLNKKVKKSDDFNDKELKIINVNDEVKIKLIVNDKGYFIDLRKYYKGYPTKKGIRILATKFVTAANILKKDVEEIFEHVNK